VISLDEAESIVKSEAYRFRWRTVEVADRVQDGWVILLEHQPNDPALARVIIRRRLQNIQRSRQTAKRGAGMAIGRMDAGWDEEIGEDPTEPTEKNIAAQQLAQALGFQPTGASRQSLQQSIARAKKRWERIKRPYD
jgi:hypothetical protein